MSRPADPLAVLRQVRRDVVADLIAIKPHLDQPYPDDPRWTPWTRFVQRALRAVDEIPEALADVERLVEAARPMATLPWPLSADERQQWIVHQNRLRDTLAMFEEERAR